MPVSIIIPMLNEEAELPGLLGSLGTLGGQPEILFVDGGSRDGSLALVRQAGLFGGGSSPGPAPPGDQTIFVRRAAFDAVGGYPEIPLMEDIEFSRRLKRLGRVACLHAPVAGSTREWGGGGGGGEGRPQWAVP